MSVCIALASSLLTSAQVRCQLADRMSRPAGCRRSVLLLSVASVAAASYTIYWTYDTLGLRFSPPLSPSLQYYAALLPLTLPACLVATYLHWTGRKLFTHN